MKKFFPEDRSVFSQDIRGLTKFEKFIADHVDDAIDITAKIRFLVDNPVVITLIKLLPEKYATKADEILKKIEAILDRVITEINIASECLQKPTFIEKLTCVIEHIRSMSPAMRSATYLKIASPYAKHSSGQESVKESVFDAIVTNRLMSKKYENELQ